MHRETQLARDKLPALDRATVHAHVEGAPGPFYYQRAAHPVGAEVERLLGELEGGPALLFPSGSGATTALALAMLEPGKRAGRGRRGLLRNHHPLARRAGPVGSGGDRV